MLFQWQTSAAGPTLRQLLWLPRRPALRRPAYLRALCRALRLVCSVLVHEEFYVCHGPWLGLSDSFAGHRCGRPRWQRGYFHFGGTLSPLQVAIRWSFNCLAVRQKCHAQCVGGALCSAWGGVPPLFARLLTPWCPWLHSPPCGLSSWWTCSESIASGARGGR